MNSYVSVILTGICLLSPATYAQNAYMGIGVGSASYSKNNFDDSDTGFNIYGGMKINENFGLELSYTDFGKQEDEYTSVFTLDASVEATGLGFAAVGFLPISDHFMLLGKIGVIALDAEVTLGTQSEKEDGSDLLYGFGAEYQFSEQFSIRGIWDFVYIKGTDLDMLSINAEINF